MRQGPDLPTAVTSVSLRGAFTWLAVLAGMRACAPLVIGLVPFGLVFGIIAQGTGLTLAAAGIMSGTTYAGSAQLVALSGWGSPTPILSAGLTGLVVNLRLALMGPVLAPWLDRLRGWRLWCSLFVMADQNWAMAVREMQAGRWDAGYLFGSGALMWLVWVTTTLAGWMLGGVLRPAPGHPMFFAALAIFVALLVPMWRGRSDLLPWLVAAIVSCLVSRVLPGTSWYIVAGAIAGAAAGVARDQLRQRPGRDQVR